MEPKTPSLKYCKIFSYAFNGKEKDDEVSGSGNSYDYGERIYDARLGRWLSTDPLFKLQPGYSTYKSFANNPISYQDPGGKTEFESITINDQRTGKSMTITRAVSNDVFKSNTKITWTRLGMPVDEVTWSDKVHHTTYNIDKKGNVTVSYKSEFGAKRTITSGPFKDSPLYAKFWVKASSWDKDLEGKGENQRGGFFLTSKDGGESPTKTRSLSDAEERDVEDLLTVLGALGSGNASMLGKASMGTEIADKIKDLADIIEDTDEVIDYYSGDNPPPKKYVCDECKDSGSKHDTVSEEQKKDHVGPFRLVKDSKPKSVPTKTKTLN